MYDRQKTKRIKTRAIATVPATIEGASVSCKEKTVEFSTATCPNEYTIMIRIIAKPQAKATVDDVLPSEFPSSVELPKQRVLSNKKWMLYESILFISSFIAIKNIFKNLDKIHE